MGATTLLAAAVIGVAVGFLGGMLGKGGSAIATPLLHAVCVPAIIAIAAPLPAAIPSTFAEGTVYWRERLIDWHACGGVSDSGYLQPSLERSKHAGSTGASS